MLKQTEGQRTGREGERWFHNALPTNWILQPPLDDVGADGVVVICEDGPLNGTEFRIQVKSSKQWPIRDGMCCIRGVRRDAVMYWLTGFTLYSLGALRVHDKAWVLRVGKQACRWPGLPSWAGQDCEP